MNKFYLSVILALAVLGGGYFLVQAHGKSEYRRGFVDCQNVGAALATEAGEQLKNELQKFYTPTTADRMLLDSGWVRDKNDK